MEKIEYKVIKDKDFIGKRFNSYTIEKTITYADGDKETRLRSFIPCRDGDINRINLDNLYFPVSVSYDEWQQLPEEYNRAWLKGTITKEMSEDIERRVLLMRANKRMKAGVM